VLLDTPVPSGGARQDPFAALELVAEILRLYGPAIDLGDLRSLGAAAARVRLAALLEEAGGLPEGQGERFVAHIAATVEAHIHALARYIVKPYAGSVTLLRTHDHTDETPEDGTDEFSFDWSVLCAGSAGVEVVPGTHRTMIFPPHVNELGKVLDRALDAGATPAAGEPVVPDERRLG